MEMFSSGHGYDVRPFGRSCMKLEYWFSGAGEVSTVSNVRNLSFSYTPKKQSASIGTGYSCSWIKISSLNSHLRGKWAQNLQAGDMCIGKLYLKLIERLFVFVFEIIVLERLFMFDCSCFLVHQVHVRKNFKQNIGPHARRVQRMGHNGQRQNYVWGVPFATKVAFGSLQGMPLVLGLPRRGVPTRGGRNVQGIQQEAGDQNSTTKVHDHCNPKPLSRPTCLLLRLVSCSPKLFKIFAGKWGKQGRGTCFLKIRHGRGTKQKRNQSRITRQNTCHWLG